MADSPDLERTMSPMELYEKLTAQGDQVRALKTAKADKVSTTELSKIFICLLTSLIPRTTYLTNHFHYLWGPILNSSIHIMKLQSNSLFLYTEQKCKWNTFFWLFSWADPKVWDFFMCVIVPCRHQVNCTDVIYVAHSKMPFLKKKDLWTRFLLLLKFLWVISAKNVFVS